MTEHTLNFEELLLKEARELPAEYLPNLIQLVRVFRETVTLQPAGQSFRQGWQEALSGQTQDVSELWDGLDAG